MRSYSNREQRSWLPGKEGQLVLHDLVRDFIKCKLGAEELCAAHAAILQAYHDSAPPGKRWPDDDSYLYDHLAYHLEQLAKVDRTYLSELMSMFADQEWMKLRFNQSYFTYEGYLADLDRCWELRHGDLVSAIRNDSDVAQAWADSLRFALILSLIVSLAASYVPALVVQAVRTGVWSVERGIQCQQACS